MTAINLRNLTAFHEAGHCVVAKFFGFVLSVDIVPDLAQDRLGICMARTAAWQREQPRLPDVFALPDQSLS